MNLRYLPVIEADGAYQMALDEAILRTIVNGNGENTLRFYRFKPSCVSIGYFQSANQEINMERCSAQEIACVRRITGGGAVFHDYHGEITYSIVLREEEFPYGIEEAYEEICTCLVKALACFGLKGEFSPINDVIVNGKKISGSAQTRKRGTILQHGTFMYSTDIKTLFSVLKVSSEKIRDKLIKSAEKRVTTLEEILGRKVGVQEVLKALEAGFSSKFNLKKGEISQYEKKILPDLKEKYASKEWLFKR